MEINHSFSGSSGNKEGCNSYILVFLSKARVLDLTIILLLLALGCLSHLILLFKELLFLLACLLRSFCVRALNDRKREIEQEKGTNEDHRHEEED